MDLKLKNANSLNDPSDYWSVEIMKQHPNGDFLDGWFADPETKTDLYVFEDAYGESWNSISAISLVFFGKRNMERKIVENTKLTLGEIKSMAVSMLEDFRPVFKKTLSGGVYLKKSQPDQDRPVVNLVFKRQWIEDISKSKTYSKGE